MSPVPGHHLSETTWRRSAAVAFFVLTAVFAGLLYRAEHRISKVESPCIKYGSDSKQCEEAFSAAIVTITHAQACAVNRKSGVLKAIRELRPEETGASFTEPCLGARLAQEEQRSNERRHTREAAGERGEQRQPGGDAPQTGSTGHQQPSPSPSGGGGNGAGKGGKTDSHEAPSPVTGGSGGGSEPASSDSTTTSPPASPGTTPEPSREPPAPPPAPAPQSLPETVEAAGGTVGKTGEAAQGAVEETGKAAGCVLRGGC
jgi:hypothetical protein